MTFEVEFRKWFDSFFCDVQNDDTPYNYDDVKLAFKAGWKLGKKVGGGRK